MANLSNLNNILNFWVKSSIPGAFMVESDLIADYVLTFADLEQWLLSINKIGCYYSDDGYGDITVTLEDVLKDVDAHELNQLIDEYMKENVLPKSGIEYEKLLQEYKHVDMWDFAPMPETDTYSEIEAQQRPPAPQLEERELKLF